MITTSNALKGGVRTADPETQIRAVLQRTFDAIPDVRLLQEPPPSRASESATHAVRAGDLGKERARPWAELLKRAFQIDVEICPNCGDAEEWSKDRGRLKLRTLVIEARNIERLLRHLGEPLEPPKRAPARDPPYFHSKVLRRKFGELNWVRAMQRA